MVYCYCYCCYCYLLLLLLLLVVVIVLSLLLTQPNQALALFQRLTFDTWSVVVHVKGQDVQVNLKVRKDGNFEAEMDLEGEKQVVQVNLFYV